MSGLMGACTLAGLCGYKVVPCTGVVWVIFLQSKGFLLDELMCT